MNKRTTLLLGIFFSVILPISVLAIYVFITQGNLQPKLFFTTCFQVINSMQEHLHLNPQAILSLFIMTVLSISAVLVAIQFISFLISYYHLKSQPVYKNSQVNSKLNKLLKKHSLNDEIIIIIGGNKLVAYTFGLFKPKIVISKLLLQKSTYKQLEAIVLHELFHIQKGHILWSLSIRLLSYFFFFTPILKYLYNELRTEFELSADCYVEKVQKTNRYLKQAIILNLQYSKSGFPHFASSPIEKRVEHLVNKRFPFEKVGFWQFSLSIVSFLLMLSIATSNTNQVFARYIANDNPLCNSKNSCKSSGCIEYGSIYKDAYTIFIPASFQSSYSH